MLGPKFRLGATRMDMHVHSHASDMPVLAAAGLIGAAECYSEPEHIYDQARARGMDLVTITDHDTIKGAMELADRGFERFVIGEEVTTRFPEDGCVVHVLVWNLTPCEHDQIEALGLRRDIYEFAAWLFERDLAHSLAHPLYAQNAKLQTRHIEIATLLFRCFESLSGAHLGKHRDVLDRYLDSLTSQRIATLAGRHGVDPIWPHAAEKGRTGGSDDHGLINIGRTWTEVRSTNAEKIAEPTEFLAMVMAGRCEAGGVGGRSEHLAHQFTAVAARYARTRIGPDCDAAARLIASKLGRFAGVAIERPSRLALMARKCKKTLLRRAPELPIVDALREHLRPTLARYPDLRARLDPARWTEGPALGEHERMAQFADELFEALGRAMFSPAQAAILDRDMPKCRKALLSYALLGIAQVPDLAAMYVQNKDRRFVERFEHETSDLERLPARQAGQQPTSRPMRVAMFTDTLGDVNGVCRFIQDTAAHAAETGRDLEVITSTLQASPGWDNVSNFEPMATLPLHGYESLDLVLPPVTRMLRHLDRRQPDLVHISTPGPVGLVGMLAAKILDVPIVGVHHTDFPAYAERILDDSAAHFASRSLRWMYSTFDMVFARSAFYTDALSELGVPAERVALIPPGVDVDTFHPRFRDTTIWSKLPEGDRPPSVKALYVGRLSIEKNMPMLAEIWQRTAAACAERGLSAELVFVGDGPYREKMEQMLPPQTVRFVGFRRGAELSAIYASADVFVFPSVTDTLGQVVLEALASGVTTLVSDRGGPQEMVEDGVTGSVLPSASVDAWADRLVAVIADTQGRSAMGRRAHLVTSARTTERSFEAFWSAHEAVWRRSLAANGIKTSPEPDLFQDIESQ